MRVLYITFENLYVVLNCVYISVTQYSNTDEIRFQNKLIQRGFYMRVNSIYSSILNLKISNIVFLN